jgi:hypothetical protein
MNSPILGDEIDVKLFLFHPCGLEKCFWILAYQAWKASGLPWVGLEVAGERMVREVISDEPIAGRGWVKAIRDGMR